MLRTDCPSCGTVDVTVDDAALVLVLDSATGHVLRYTCPSCRQQRTETIEERATRLLMAAGIGLVGSADSPISPDGPASR